MDAILLDPGDQRHVRAPLSISWFKNNSLCTRCQLQIHEKSRRTCLIQISIDLFGTCQTFMNGPNDQGRSSLGVSGRKQSLLRIDQVRACFGLCGMARAQAAEVKASLTYVSTPVKPAAMMTRSALRWRALPSTTCMPCASKRRSTVSTACNTPSSRKKRWMVV